MNRKTTWILIFAILTVMIFLSQQENGSLVGDLSSAQQAISETTSVAAPANRNIASDRASLNTNPSTSTPRPSPSQIAATPSPVAPAAATSTANLEARTERVEDLSARLSQLQTQAEDLAAELNNSSQVQSLTSQRQALGFSLQSLNAQEEEIFRRTEDALSNQSHVSQTAYQQLERSIQEQSDLIAQTQNERAAWDTPFISDRSGQEEALLTLNERLAQQTAELENLRQQRLSLANQILAGQQGIQQQREVALDQVQQERFNLQNQSSSLNEEITAQQKLQWQRQAELKNLQDQIRQTQQALQNQQRQLQNSEAITE